MPGYYLLGLYRFHAPFPADVVVRTMSTIARRLPDFFPAELPVARKRSVRLLSPEDFDPSLVPAAFTIEPGVCVRIPIDGGGGARLAITDDRAPSIVPANVLLKFTAALPPLASLEELLADLIAKFEPDDAMLTDNATPVEEDVEKRRFEVDESKVPAWFSWLTWLNPSLIEAAGPEALARLSSVCHVRPLAGGALVRVQDEPTDGNDPAWSRRRQAAEDAFGLAALQRRFPRIVPGAE